MQDTGRGIPADKLQTVDHDGKRGSNMGEVRTMGGSFGLTKAFLVTQPFGGRFRIRSEPGWAPVSGSRYRGRSRGQRILSRRFRGRILHHRRRPHPAALI